MGCGSSGAGPDLGLRRLAALLGLILAELELVREQLERIDGRLRRVSRIRWHIGTPESEE